MDTSNMKNMIVIKNLPSNIVEEAIVVLKENKKVKKYANIGKESNDKRVNDSGYIVKEAENVIKDYIKTLDNKSLQEKNDIKKLRNKYKKSVKLNFILGILIILSIIISLI